MNGIGFWWDIKTANIEYYDIQYAAERAINYEFWLWGNFISDWYIVWSFLCKTKFDTLISIKTLFYIKSSKNVVIKSKVVSQSKNRKTVMKQKFKRLFLLTFVYSKNSILEYFYYRLEFLRNKKLDFRISKLDFGIHFGPKIVIPIRITT